MSSEATPSHRTPPSSPQLVKSVAQMRSIVGAPGSSVGPPHAVVMTMGALHDGHASLLKLARELAGPDGRVSASIFVNPLQFGPAEDLDSYPRTLEADLAVCANNQVDVVFAPPVVEMYPAGSPATTVSAGTLGTQWEGASRPGHFDGVLTVVCKLLHIMQPRWAIFGEKDYQQLTVIKRMVQDLSMEVEVVPGATIRETDGLAMSSRNHYLSPSERQAASVIPRTLTLVEQALARGATVDEALTQGRELMATEPSVELDYLVVRACDLGPYEQGQGRALVAARVGTTRLIDNCAISTVPSPAVQQESL